MRSKIAAAARSPNGKTISIGWTGCPRNLIRLSTVISSSLAPAK
jgi:hypothetical protein